ncbi:FtsB family cell division protein [Lacisediminihabitans changchengi]|uniref:Septum formation initiator family protein n=1 Tax=Lacisediminihabitans changchengi TaxID=2787634 RepID=A0A934SKG6_9MICO|nr:septum formation initiator family protein [Lacisediminihabitans changchengi]MBK4347233.1 septum formation initiator family protein [Lacisediminihabitans changchengi]
MARTPRSAHPKTPRIRTERVAVRMPEEGAHGQWLRSIRLSGFTIIALGLIVLAVVVLAPSLRIYIEQRQQIAALQAAVQDAKNSVGELKQQNARWDDPTYIEAQARERLDYVFPGDFSFLVIDDGATAPATTAQPISKDIQTTKVDWVQSMLSSVFTAGLSDAPRNELIAPTIGVPTPTGSPTP